MSLGLVICNNNNNNNNIFYNLMKLVSFGCFAWQVGIFQDFQSF